MYGTQEHPAEHLEYLGWIAGKAEGWRVTPLGQALLRAADTDEDDVRVVVLDNKDPLAYATLIGELAGMGDAFLVDPYLDLAGCADLVAHTKIARVLMGDSPGSKKHREAVAVFLSSGQYDVEVRVAPGIHDRLVIADDGLVYTIGASLNGVSRRKAITVLTPLPQAAAETMSKAIESLWPDATVLTQPQPDSAEDTGTDEA